MICSGFFCFGLTLFIVEYYLVSKIFFMIKHFVYILYSQKIDKYYIGETHDVNLRIEKHNEDYYDNKWTKKGKPWCIYFSIECLCKRQAKQVEQHIKRMKSRKYIENLAKYPEISNKLLSKYKDSCSEDL